MPTTSTARRRRPWQRQARRGATARGERACRGAARGEHARGDAQLGAHARRRAARERRGGARDGARAAGCGAAGGGTHEGRRGAPPRNHESDLASQLHTQSEQALRLAALSSELSVELEKARRAAAAEVCSRAPLYWPAASTTRGRRGATCSCRGAPRAAAGGAPS
jgi:hypothetical protein